MKLTIANNEHLDAWLNERRKMGRDVFSIKGSPPEGATPRMRDRTEAAERRCRTVPLDAIVGRDARIGEENAIRVE